jgi:hypothetical protein
MRGNVEEDPGREEGDVKDEEGMLPLKSAIQSATFCTVVRLSSVS